MKLPVQRRVERGSALVVAIVVVVIISLLAVGLIRMAALETSGALAGARREALAQCAEAAAHYLTSKFHVLGMNPTSITAMNVPLDGPNGTTWGVSGHYDTAPANSNIQGFTVSQVVALPEKSTGPVKVDDESNVIRFSGMRSGLRVIVHCWTQGVTGDPTSGRQLEVELGIRFGL